MQTQIVIEKKHTKVHSRLSKTTKSCNPLQEKHDINYYCKLQKPSQALLWHQYLFQLPRDRFIHDVNPSLVTQSSASTLVVTPMFWVNTSIQIKTTMVTDKAPSCTSIWLSKQPACDNSFPCICIYRSFPTFSLQIFGSLLWQFEGIPDISHSLAT